MAKVVDVKIEDNSEEVLEAMNEQVLDWLEAIGEDAAGTAADRAPVGTPESTGIPGPRRINMRLCVVTHIEKSSKIGKSF